jgi:circadian clock protein KaiB
MTGAYGQGPDQDMWYLRLHVASESPKSLRAFANSKRLCENHMDHPYEIEVVDQLENPKAREGRRDPRRPDAYSPTASSHAKNHR